MAAALQSGRSHPARQFGLLSPKGDIPRAGANAYKAAMTADQQPHDAARERGTFPTAWRERVSAGRAYPLGAEDLFNALALTPQAGLLSCHFSSSRALGARRRAKVKPQFRGEVIEPPLYQVLKFKYEKRERSIYSGDFDEQRGAFDPSWTITVSAVPSEMRSAIRRALLEHGLPSIAQPWLLKHSVATGLIGTCEISLRYDAETGSLLGVENDALQPASP